MPQPPFILVSVEQTMPAAPPLRVSFTAAVYSRRSTEVLRSQRQWLEPAQIKTTGPSSQTWGTFERGIGVDPPALINPGPTQRQQTLSVYCLSASSQARQVLERFPLQGHTPAQTVRSNIFADDFNRADGGLGANWVAGALGQATGLTILSNQVRTTTGGSASAATIALTSGDWSIQVDVPVWVNGGQIYLAAVDIQVGAAFNGYVLIVSGAASTQLYRADKGVATPILAIPVQPVNGDTWRITKQGTTLTVARRLAGAGWIDLGSISDDKYVTAGFFPELAIVTNNNIRVDNFSSVELGLIAAGFNRLIGPRRPTVVNSVIPEKTAASVALTAVAQRVARTARISHVDLLPPTVLGLPPPSVVVYSIHVTLAPTPRRFVKSFLYEPQAVSAATAAPTELTVHVTLAHARPRPVRSFFVRAVDTPPVGELAVVFVRTRPRAVRSALSAPQVVLPTPSQRAQTISVALAAQPKQARKPHSNLSPPVVVLPLPTLQVQTIRVSLARIAPRKTHWLLGPPGTPALARPVRVSLVQTRPRKVSSRLYAPTALQTFSGPAVRTVRTRPRRTATRLSPPTIILPLPSQQAETVVVKLVPSSKSARAPHSRLALPAVVIPSPSLAAQTVDVRLAVARRPSRRSFFSTPLYTAIPVNFEVPATLVRTRPRKTIARLAPPTVVGFFQPPVAITLSRKTRPRPIRSSLAAPAVVATALAPPLKIKLVTTRPRPVRSRLSAPAVITTPLAPPLKVEFATIRPRPVRSVLRPQGIVRPEITRLTSSLAASQPASDPRRRPRSHLQPPAVVGAAQRAPDALRIALAAQGRTSRRAFRSDLSPPAIIAAAALARPALARFAPAPRRFVHSRLAPPVVITLPLARPLLARFAPAPRRFVRSRLSPPAVVTSPLARPTLVSLAKIARRGFRSELQPPAVVAPATLARPIEVALAAQARRKLRSFWTSPVSTPPVQTRIHVTLAPSARRPGHSTLRPPATLVRALAPPVKVALASIQTRLAHRPANSELGKPIPPAPPLARRALTSLTKMRPRRTTVSLRTPAVVVPLASLGQRTLKVLFHTAVEGRRKRPLPHSELSPPTKVTTFDGQIEYTVGTPRGNWRARRIEGRWKSGVLAGDWTHRALSGRWRAARVRGNWKDQRESHGRSPNQQS